MAISIQLKLHIAHKKAPLHVRVYKPLYFFKSVHLKLMVDVWYSFCGIVFCAFLFCLMCIFFQSILNLCNLVRCNLKPFNIYRTVAPWLSIHFFFQTGSYTDQQLIKKLRKLHLLMKFQFTFHNPEWLEVNVTQRRKCKIEVNVTQK